MVGPSISRSLSNVHAVPPTGLLRHPTPAETEVESGERASFESLSAWRMAGGEEYFRQHTNIIAGLFRPDNPPLGTSGCSRRATFMNTRKWTEGPGELYLPAGLSVREDLYFYSPFASE
jgi:hypothetical protein